MSRPRPDRRVLRIRVDLAIEADKPFNLPEINPGAFTTVCAVVAAQHVQKSGEVRLLPNGEIFLQMLAEPPPRMRVRKPKKAAKP